MVRKLVMSSLYIMSIISLMQHNNLYCVTVDELELSDGVVPAYAYTPRSVRTAFLELYAINRTPAWSAAVQQVAQQMRAHNPLVQYPVLEQALREITTLQPELLSPAQLQTVAALKEYEQLVAAGKARIPITPTAGAALKALRTAIIDRAIITQLLEVDGFTLLKDNVRIEGNEVIVGSLTVTGDIINPTSAAVTNGTNVGDGAAVFAQKDGSILDFRTLTSTDASVTITQNAATIDLQAASSGGAITFDTQGGGTATTVASTLLVPSTTNNITTSAAGNTLTLNLSNTPTVSGTITTTGGSIALPNSDAGETMGEITLGGTRFISNAGTQNTFVGSGSGNPASSGAGQNTCIGYQAGSTITTGQGNICIGAQAGEFLGSNDSFNIIIGTQGSLFDSDVLRIGEEQTRAFIAGIWNNFSIGGDATAVFVDDTGLLGVMPSSARYKNNITDLSASASNSIYQLRPVTFAYTLDTTNKTQYGLIAEEVAQVLPNLVTYDKAGLPMTVKYHNLPILLLKEIQRLNERITVLESKIA